MNKLKKNCPRIFKNKRLRTCSFPNPLCSGPAHSTALHNVSQGRSMIDSGFIESAGLENQHACMFNHSVMSNSLQLHGLWPARLLCPWDFPSKNTGVGCHFLFQGIVRTQESNSSCSDSSATPSYPSQLEWKVGLPWANTRCQVCLCMNLP